MKVGALVRCDPAPCCAHRTTGAFPFRRPGPRHHSARDRGLVCWEWLSLKNTVILNGVSPRAKAGAKRREGSLKVQGGGGLVRCARLPSHRLRPRTVSDSSLHSRPPSPAGNSVQNDGVVFGALRGEKVAWALARTAGLGAKAQATLRSRPQAPAWSRGERTSELVNAVDECLITSAPAHLYLTAPTLPSTCGR